MPAHRTRLWVQIFGWVTLQQPCAFTLDTMHTWQRFTAIATGVAALHGAALWAAHSYRVRTDATDKPPALVTRSVEVPKQPDAAPVALPQPAPETSAAPVPTSTPAKTKAATTASAKTATPPDSKLPAITLALPAVNTAPAPAVDASSVPAGAAAPSSVAAAMPLSAVQTAKTSAAPAPSQLPVTDADHADTQYRHPRPAISMRLGEAGRVVVRVQVGVDGKALQVLLLKSSGYTRLDDNALATVARWRFKPGLRGGVPEVMWVEQSVNYDAP